MTTGATAHEGSKPPCLRDDALAVLTRLREAGHVAYFAGGCVRDELLGLTPKDYDVATDAPPERVRQLFTNTQAVGAAFGVILVRHKKSVVEVATFRTDGKYLDGRRPEAVTFTNAEEDAKRRDFTINGLFLDPIENRVIDYVGGQEDLKNKVLRAIGDPNHRFEEDHLRLLRAVRFAARFGLKIEERTDKAIKDHAAQLVRISPERIAEELRIMLTATTRGTAWDLIGNYGLDLFARFFEFGAGLDLARINSWHRGFFGDIEPARPIPFGLALAGAMLELAMWQTPMDFNYRELLDRRVVQQMVRAVRKALRISNDEADEMSGTLEGLAPLLHDELPSVVTLKRFLARPTAPLSRALLNALGPGYVGEKRFEWLSGQLRSLEQTEFAPQPLITGDDLTDAGLKPGRAFKVALDQTYDAQLEGRVTTRKQAIEMAIGIAKGEPV